MGEVTLSTSNHKKGTSSGASLETRTELGHRLVIVLEMAWVSTNGESSLMNSVISHQEPVAGLGAGCRVPLALACSNRDFRRQIPGGKRSDSDCFEAISPGILKSHMVNLSGQVPLALACSNRNFISQNIFIKWFL